MDMGLICRGRNGLCWWLHNSVNIPETIELYNLNRWIVWKRRISRVANTKKQTNKICEEGIWWCGAGRTRARELPAWDGELFHQLFWSIKPLEADTIGFSLNHSCYFSASLHYPSVQAWEVMLEERARMRGLLPLSPRSQCPGDNSVVPQPAPWRALQSLPISGPAIWHGHQRFPFRWLLTAFGFLSSAR